MAGAGVELLTPSKMFFTREEIEKRFNEINDLQKIGAHIDLNEIEVLAQLMEIAKHNNTCQSPESSQIDLGIKKIRGWRNKVDPLTLNYEDYRKTKLWKAIKARIFSRDNKLCKRCGGTADIVHHTSYDSAVMLGQNDSKLVALCSGCHEIVHFSSLGVRRNQEEQLAALTDMSLNEVMPKIDLRRTRRNPPSWSRLTSMQKGQWNEEFNQRKLEQLAKKILKHKLINKPKVEHD